MTNLTPAERRQGWVEFRCPNDGFLVATTPNAAVVCSCGKRAQAYRNGRKLSRAARARRYQPVEKAAV